MNDYILPTVKKMLGIDPIDNGFDTDILVGINTAIMELGQFGIGDGTFVVEDNTAAWSDFVPKAEEIEGVKNYVYMKTRLNFDPPSSSTVMEAMNRRIDETMWRLNHIAEKG